MRAFCRFLGLATVAAICLPATIASAQSSDNSARLVAADDLPAIVLAHIERGDAWIAKRDYGKARAAYQAAADILREDGELPAVPMRRIAHAYYFEGKYHSAIRALDDLADEAATRGDVATEAWAKIDAAWVMGRECFGRTDRRGFRLEIHERVDEVKDLLESPYMPDDVRAEITAKRCDGCHAVEPEDRRDFTCYPSNGR